MRKLLTASVVASSLFSAGAVSAAPASLICADAAARNCFKDEVFLLDGNTTVDRAGTPTPLVGCKASGDCYITSAAEQFTQVGLGDAVGKALEAMRAKEPNLPGWDEVVVFTADFGPTRQTGPLFYRAVNQEGAKVNRVQNIGTGDVAEPDAEKPYVGIIDAGNVKALGATPWSSLYSPCGKLPRPVTDPPVPSADQPAGALCAPGAYTYFDALAQASAAIYGPHLAGPDATTALVAPPAIKAAIVTSAGVSKFPTSGMSVDTWNALLDMGGSVLGGNTWRNDGNGAMGVAKPTANFDASLPYEGTQIVRFMPLDLYTMGFAPSSGVSPIRSLIKASPVDVYLPAGVDKWTTVVGPNMGTRIAGVVLRTKANVPATINMSDILAANGGERIPAADSAPQHLRQLWILVTKPDFLRDQIAEDAVKAAAAGSDAEAVRKTSRDDQAKEQDTEISNMQKFRRAFGPYFYMLAGYTGRAVTTYEGNVDDTSYWEFADVADDQKVFSAGGGLEMEMKGPQLVPNGGGKKMTALTVKKTPGEAGVVNFKATADLAMRIHGSTKASTSPNNLLTVRMRLPNDRGLIGQIKGKVILSGAKGKYTATFPSHEKGFLIPDGLFHTYSVVLSHTYSVVEADNPDGGVVESVKTTENTEFTGKEYDTFQLVPSTVAMSAPIDVEYIRIGNTASIVDDDKNCSGKLEPDGWLAADDNCPRLFNPDQLDMNGNGIGDACEDYDGDTVLNSCDNCAATGNSDQSINPCKGEGPKGCGVTAQPSSRPAWAVGFGLLALGLALAARNLRRARK